METAQRSTGVDLEALETAVKRAVLESGAQVIEDFLLSVGVGRRDNPVLCKCGHVMKSTGVRTKLIQLLLGNITFARSRYQCPHCGKVRYPGDEELDMVGTSRSPGVLRQVARLGAKETFHEVSKDLKELAFVELSRKDAERIAEKIGNDMEKWDKVERERLRSMEPPPPEAPKTISTMYIEYDGTGVPMIKKEVEGRKGKQEDGSAKTREAKLGCVFTQTIYDEKGRPVRDPATTSFTGAIECSDKFGWRIYSEAIRRGLFEAECVVIITDGAKWCKSIAQTHFPNAVHIVDLYHAREHMINLSRFLHSRNLQRLNHYKDRWWNKLDEGDIETILEEAKNFLPKNPNSGKDARREIGYFENNKERMRYAKFKAKGLFVGSGVIEAGCKNVIGKRLKQSGMEWTERGANDIISLRCVTASGRIEEYWEQRAG